MSLVRTATVFVVALVALITAGSESASAQDHSMHSGPVMNYHRIDERLLTGGHFVDDGLDEVKAEGVQVVIDLRDKPPAG